MIDTHAHIYLEQFKEDLPEAMDRLRTSGVKQVLMPNIDHTSIEDMLEVEQRYPHTCISMMGLHPCSVNADFEKELYLVEEWLGKREFLAVGEIGTDLYWDKTFYPQQVEAFNIQCELALKHDLPIVIHCRESIDETIALTRPFSEKGLTGVFHCFTGDLEQANQITDLGFKLGIGGVATFKNGGMDKVLPHVDIKHLVLETDSPYLAPVPHRGKRNEPAYVRLVAERLVTLKGMAFQKVVQQTTANARELFKLPTPA
ncbi:MAG: TatD family hydrolase [Cytophagales bacterium]|nr:TatD family hydrolase [Cytophagales bacterium]